MIQSIAGKTVVLTGASGGIGLDIARTLAKEQATVVGISRSIQRLEIVDAEVKALGGKSIIIPFDISNLQELPVLVQQINQLAGSVDILINNAAIEKCQLFKNASLVDIESMLLTNLLAPMELTRLLLPKMICKGTGYIVNVASLAGKKGTPYNSIYSASKAGLIMWSDAMRQELAGTKVGVSIICPGYVSAGMFLRTKVPAPKFAGTSTSTEVATAIVKAIQYNKAEVIVNSNFSRMLYALEQFSPKFVDAIYRWIGVAKLNQKRAENQRCTKNLI